MVKIVFHGAPRWFQDTWVYIGGRNRSVDAQRARRAPSWPPPLLVHVHSKSPGSRLFQKDRSRRFHSVWTSFDIHFLRNTGPGRSRGRGWRGSWLRHRGHQEEGGGGRRRRTCQARAPSRAVRRLDSKKEHGRGGACEARASASFSDGAWSWREHAKLEGLLGHFRGQIRHAGAEDQLLRSSGRLW